MVYTVKEENMMERVKKGDMWGEKEGASAARYEKENDRGKEMLSGCRADEQFALGCHVNKCVI